MAVLAPPSSLATINIQFYEVSSKEGYGFALYLATICLYVFYLLWAFIPDGPQMIGIAYVPNRDWAIIVPMWIMSWIPFIIFAYVGYNMYTLPALESPYTFTDELANVMDINTVDLERLTSPDAIPELQDVPLFLINETLWSDAS